MTKALKRMMILMKLIPMSCEALIQGYLSKAVLKVLTKVIMTGECLKSSIRRTLLVLPRFLYRVFFKNSLE